ncbi:transglutaminase-like cysteine peptidase [Azospirillum sp. ST 5-10]|uniref:transglutaminase-like cysteine peptidase n=1 Tax=unclassified Azospirillum TaxID=2630922 RepID=UPI003F49EDE1
MRIIWSGLWPPRAAAAAAVVAGSAALAGCATPATSVAPAALSAPARPGGGPAIRPAAFAVPETRLTGPSPAPQWTRLLARHNHALDTPETVPAAWRRMVEDLRGLELPAKLERANALINRLPYVPSERKWGRRDYWETPFEFIAGSGQCQDFAATKYLLLRAAGVPEDRLRLAVVQDHRTGVAHAIVVALVDDQALVLDNQIDGVVPTAAVGHYEPLYALGETGWWLYDSGRHQARGAAAFDRTALADLS